MSAPSIVINKWNERKFDQKSRAEIIELYRSTMTNDNKLDHY